MSRRIAPVKKTDIKTSTKVVPRTSSGRLGQSTSGTEISVVSKSAPRSGLGRQIVNIKPSDERIGMVPSQLQKSTFRQALVKSVRDPRNKVSAVGGVISQTTQPTVVTKRGKEKVLQQMKMETTVQRTPRAEYIGKTMVGIDVGKAGLARKIELTSQQIDPTHGTESAGINETVSVASTLSVTKKGKYLDKDIKKRTVISERFRKQPNRNPHHVNRLVKEETEDIENTLKMVPPELVSKSVEKFPLKRKLQKLRLTAEPVSLLTQSIIQPVPTADEVEAEAPPEVVASVIDAVEKGATPHSAPNQIFNSLFPEVQEERMNISSVAPGPLQDLVVPTEPPKRYVDEMLSQEMENFLTTIQNQQDFLPDDICSSSQLKLPESSTPKNDKRIPIMLEAEVPPWEDMAVQNIAGLVGGNPLELLNVTDTSEIQTESIVDELSKGVEYFLDADVAPYETKIQLRGSKLPKWFPGYMSAFPHLPELVEIAKDPNEVLYAAWRATQPKVFPEDSLLIA